MNKIHSINIRDYNKLHSSGKIIKNTTEEDTRIQSFPDIVPAVNQVPVNINLQNPKILAPRVEKRAPGV